MNGNAKLWTGETVRSELIRLAQHEARGYYDRNGKFPTGEWAVARATDGCDSVNGTLSVSIRKTVIVYAGELSDAAYFRICKEVQKWIDEYKECLR